MKRSAALRRQFLVRAAGRCGRHPQSAVGPAVAAGGSAAAAEEGEACERNSGKFRFWHDERRYKGDASGCIVQSALFEAGGVRTGGYPKSAPIAGPLGFQRMSDWDVLWSPARSALKAVPLLKPWQLASAVPGLYALTKKRRLGATLFAAYGEHAWQLVPQSFALPAELPAFEAWLQEQARDRTNPGPWMLKTAQHLGKGLVLLPGKKAFNMAKRPRPAGAKPFVLAQRYVADPLLIRGQKFGIRLWLLVTGTDPFTAYVHSQGLVLFSTESYDADSLSDTDGSAGKSHITNYAMNKHGTVWDLAMLKQHLGSAAWSKLWAALVSSTAHVAAAAMGEVRAEHAKLQAPAHSTFELLGLDYLIDASMHPWLLEVNGTPSLAVDHGEPAVEQLIRDAKSSMVQDMLQLLDVRNRFAYKYELLRMAAGTSPSMANVAKRRLEAQAPSVLPDARERERVEGELRNRGGFLPLMAHFPLRFGAAAAAVPPLARPGDAARSGAAAQQAAVPAAVAAPAQAQQEQLLQQAQLLPPAAWQQQASEQPEPVGLAFTARDLGIGRALSQAFWQRQQRLAGTRKKLRASRAVRAAADAAAAAPEGGPGASGDDAAQPPDQVQLVADGDSGVQQVSCEAPVAAKQRSRRRSRTAVSA